MSRNVDLSCSSFITLPVRFSSVLYASVLLVSRSLVEYDPLLYSLLHASVFHSLSHPRSFTGTHVRFSLSPSPSLCIFASFIIVLPSPFPHLLSCLLLFSTPPVPAFFAWCRSVSVLFFQPLRILTLIAPDSPYSCLLFFSPSDCRGLAIWTEVHSTLVIGPVHSVVFVRVHRRIEWILFVR